MSNDSILVFAYNGSNADRLKNTLSDFDGREIIVMDPSWTPRADHIARPGDTIYVGCVTKEKAKEVKFE